MTPILRHTTGHLLKNWRIGIPAVLIIGFTFLLLNLLLFTNHVGRGFLNIMKGSLSFTVYLKNDIDPFSLQRLMGDLEKLPTVQTPVTYTSPEEVKQRFPAGTDLPGMLTITPKEPKDRDAIEGYLTKSPYRPFLSFPSRQEQTAEGKIYERVTTQIERLQGLIRGVLFSLLTFSFLVIVIGITASLKLGSFSRRKELAIMKLVGASPYFLEFPYLLEAMAYSFLGLLVGTIVFFFIPSLNLLPADMFIREQWESFSLGNVFLFELALALLLGLIAGFLSLQQKELLRNKFY